MKNVITISAIEAFGNAELMEQRHQQVVAQSAMEERVIELQVEREFIVKRADFDLETLRIERRKGQGLTAEQWDQWDAIEKARNIELNKVDAELCELGAI